MESYRTEEEQVEALKRWWEENGRSTVAAIVIALAGAFGWQGWQGWQANKAEAASDLYQDLIRARAGAATVNAQGQDALSLAQQLKVKHPGSTYAQFAALHLAALAVDNKDTAEAETQLRWVLSKADSNSDTANVAQLRLARILADRGETDQALAILSDGPADAYQASYAMARGDVLMSLGREDDARQAYLEAQTQALLAGQQMPVLQAKLQRLTPAAQTAISDGSVSAGEAKVESAEAEDAAPNAAQAVDSLENVAEEGAQ